MIKITRMINKTEAPTASAIIHHSRGSLSPSVDPLSSLFPLPVVIISISAVVVDDKVVNRELLRIKSD